MSNNPFNNGNKMYTSTPLRKPRTGSNAPSRGRQSNRITDDDYDDDEDMTEYNQKYYSISEYNEFQSVRDDTYSSTLPELLNENELQLNIDSDTYTTFNTPNQSYQKTNYCHPKYFDKSNSLQHKNRNKDGYIDITLNQPSTSTKESSSSYRKSTSDADFKKLEYFRDRARFCIEDDEDEDSNTEDIVNLNRNKNKCKGMETYPSSPQHLKKKNATVPFIKEDEEETQNSDTMDPSTLQSSDKTVDSIFLRNPKMRKDDLAAKSDSINMLSVVISTVMLLASKSQIPQNYITWTLKYLKCIKNKQGQYPPNIKKIQNMLTSPTGQWNCIDFLAGQTMGKRMDLTKKIKKLAK